MNRCLRRVGLFVILICLNSHAFAICEQTGETFYKINMSMYPNDAKYYPEIYANLSVYLNFAYQSAQKQTDPKSLQKAEVELKKQRAILDEMPENIFRQRQYADRAHWHCLLRDRFGTNQENKAPNTSTGVASQQNQSTQQQSQQAQQQSAQAQQRAQQNQARADQARQGKRRRHEPENEASHCLSLDLNGPGFGGFVNKCDFKVAYSYCTFNPKKGSWAEGTTCGKSGGAGFVGPGQTSYGHIKNTETVYWLACKDPAWALDTEFILGRGIQGHCRTVGGK